MSIVYFTSQFSSNTHMVFQVRKILSFETSPRDSWSYIWYIINLKVVILNKSSITEKNKPNNRESDSPTEGSVQLVHDLNFNFS